MNVYILTGISRATISSIENGRRIITPKTERALIYFFNSLDKDEQLRELIVEWETEFTRVLKDKRFKDMDIEMIPSLRKVKIILDKIKVITGI
ncbi:helix-turn-helix transcriptional regulator [Candidatus Halobeggiatoa sp. HSG11]|nr:helix-turn-helix transcriptional regulator [Candidatus Halobeggiatoa sp. HSG11]